MSVKARVRQLEKSAAGTDRREDGKRFADALSRAYNDGEPVEVVTDAEFEAAMELAYGPNYRPPTEV